MHRKEAGRHRNFVQTPQNQMGYHSLCLSEEQVMPVQVVESVPGSRVCPIIASVQKVNSWLVSETVPEDIVSVLAGKSFSVPSKSLCGTADYFGTGG